MWTLEQKNITSVCIFFKLGVKDLRSFCEFGTMSGKVSIILYDGLGFWKDVFQIGVPLEYFFDLLLFMLQLRFNINAFITSLNIYSEIFCTFFCTDFHNIKINVSGELSLRIYS
jgi:hypothetical protein